MPAPRLPRPAPTALLLFAFGLALRVLFWLGGAATGSAWQAGFQGDAWLWQDLARELAGSAHRPDIAELLRLPLRPPGMQWLVATLWDGDATTAWRPLLLFAVLGALVAPLVFLLVRRPLGERPATIAGALCAAASPLLLIGSGLHNELPYLLLVLLALFDQERLRERPTALAALRLGALHGLAMLLRTEHLLVFAALLLLSWLTRAPRRLRSTALALVAAAVVLLPWQFAAMRMVADYDWSSGPVFLPAGQTPPGGLPWSGDALERLHTLPAFQRAPTYAFVTDTLRVRGAREVRAADLDVVVEAYGSWPEPLPVPFVCLYGGLNFFLANTPEADAGFSNAALDRPPPLTGGDDRYPRGLRNVLPRGGNLTLSYPPHLDLLVHGYRHGLAEIAAAPGAALARCVRKLWQTAKGAVPTLGGFALPIGLGGERRAVDMVTATGVWATVWRALVLAAAACGWWRLRRERALWPWLALLAARIAIAAAFFGYARQGALLLPVVAIGLAPLLAWLPCRRRCVATIAFTLLLLEGLRATFVAPQLDGRPAAEAQRPDRIDHVAHRVTYPLRWR